MVTFDLLHMYFLYKSHGIYVDTRMHIHSTMNMYFILTKILKKTELTDIEIDKGTTNEPNQLSGTQVHFDLLCWKSVVSIIGYFLLGLDCFVL